MAIIGGIKMNKSKEVNLEQYLKKRTWKNTNEEYIFQLDKMFDLIDNIKDDFLRIQIRNQVIKCDKTLTKIAEETFDKIKRLICNKK